MSTSMSVVTMSIPLKNVFFAYSELVGNTACDVPSGAERIWISSLLSEEIRASHQVAAVECQVSLHT